MTDSKTTPENDASNIPDEPEQMQLWRRLIELRDELVEDIPRYESLDHPERVYLLTVAGVPEGSDKIRRSDERAKITAAKLRNRLAEIDRGIRKYTSEGNDRGFSLQALRALVGDQVSRESAAFAAFCEWRKDKQNEDKHHVAALLMWRLVTGYDGTPSDFGVLPDLVAMDREDIEGRKTGGHYNRGAKNVFNRIRARLGG